MSVLEHLRGDGVEDVRPAPQPPPPFTPWTPDQLRLSLGSLFLSGRVWLAPMAGYTDMSFRRLARRFGSAMVITEMVSSRALLAERKKSYRLMEFDEAQRPVGVQLFGGDPEIMARAALDVVETVKPDLLDVNFGCPVGKILKSDSGAAVLKEPKRAGWIVKAMIEATGGKVPVTVKTRAGFETADDSVFELLAAVEEAGAAALAVHARTQKQMYTGSADWSLIRRLKEKARIPILGNGDVRSPEDAVRLFLETGCDGILIGRAAIGHPWIFEEIHAYLTTGRPLPPRNLKFRFGLAAEQLETAMRARGPRWGLTETRKHLAHTLKGFVGARELRQRLLPSEDPEWVLASFRRLAAETPEIDPPSVAL